MKPGASNIPLAAGKRYPGDASRSCPLLVTMDRDSGTGAWDLTEPRLACLPDDGGHLVGTEGPHRVRADAAERPDLKQGRRRRFIVGEVDDADEVVLADRPEQFAYPAA